MCLTVILFCFISVWITIQNIINLQRKCHCSVCNYTAFVPYKDMVCLNRSPILIGYHALITLIYC